MATRIRQDEVPHLRDRPVYGVDGSTLGTVDGVLVDDTGAVRYLEVRSGWFGLRRHAIPLADVEVRDETLIAPYTGTQLRDAPAFAEGQLVDTDGGALPADGGAGLPADPAGPVAGEDAWPTDEPVYTRVPLHPEGR